VAPASGGSGPNGQGGNNIPPLEEEVDVLSTSTASFRSEEPANEENGGIGATGGAEGPVRFDGKLMFRGRRCGDHWHRRSSSRKPSYWERRYSRRRSKRGDKRGRKSIGYVLCNLMLMI